MGQNIVSVNRIVINSELKYNGETLLTYGIEYPEFISSCYRTCLRKVNKFYKDKALEFQRYCQTELFEMAVEQYNDDIENGFPVRVFEALLVYEVTYLNSCVISVYFDRYEYTGGAHGNTVRYSQTWNLQSCGLIKLWQLVCCSPDCKAYILSEVEAQIQEEPDIYFENYKELINKTFNPNSFYCTPEGISVYYQQYDIAPYSSGIREFLMPYTYCVKNPETLCNNVTII